MLAFVVTKKIRAAIKQNHLKMLYNLRCIKNHLSSKFTPYFKNNTHVLYLTLSTFGPSYMEHVVLLNPVHNVTLRGDGSRINYNYVKQKDRLRHVNKLNTSFILAC